jgi:hypothetical protein
LKSTVEAAPIRPALLWSDRDQLKQEA